MSSGVFVLAMLVVIGLIVGSILYATAPTWPVRGARPRPGAEIESAAHDEPRPRPSAETAGREATAPMESTRTARPRARARPSAKPVTVGTEREPSPVDDGDE